MRAAVGVHVYRRSNFLRQHPFRAGYFGFGLTPVKILLPDDRPCGNRPILGPDLDAPRRSTVKGKCCQIVAHPIFPMDFRYHNVLAVAVAAIAVSSLILQTSLQVLDR